jgi:hypothetical protein
MTKMRNFDFENGSTGLGLTGVSSSAKFSVVYLFPVN